jgi:hypothetical protein
MRYDHALPIWHSCIFVSLWRIFPTCPASVRRICSIPEGGARNSSTALSVQRASKRDTKRLPGFVSRNTISRAEGEPVRAQPASTLEDVNEEKTQPQRVSEERKAQQAQTTRYHQVTNDTEERCAPLNHVHVRRAKRAGGSVPLPGKNGAGEVFPHFWRSGETPPTRRDGTTYGTSGDAPHSTAVRVAGKRTRPRSGRG